MDVLLRFHLTVTAGEHGYAPNDVNPCIGFCQGDEIILENCKLDLPLIAKRLCPTDKLGRILDYISVEDFKIEGKADGSLDWEIFNSNDDDSDFIECFINAVEEDFKTLKYRLLIDCQNIILNCPGYEPTELRTGSAHGYQFKAELIKSTRWDPSGDYNSDRAIVYDLIKGFLTYGQLKVTVMDDGKVVESSVIDEVFLGAKTPYKDAKPYLKTMYSEMLNQLGLN